ncbi:MAG: ribonuclease HII, partial [Patescibacteria group bacterium]
MCELHNFNPLGWKLSERYGVSKKYKNIVIYKYIMRRPNFQEEKKLWRMGYKRVAGLDEAGRGPLAGPVVAGAVIITRSDLAKNIWRSDLQNIRDSKKLSPKQREKIYKKIIKNPFIKWGIGIVSEKVIDKINILEATKLAMIKAVDNLEAKSQKPKVKIKSKKLKADYLILDGKMSVNLP